MDIIEKEILEILKRLESKFDGLEGRFDGLDVKFGGLEDKVDENTKILRALEHSAEVSKAEHDKTSNNIDHIKGDIEAIRKDISNVEIITSSNWSDLAKLKAAK